MSGLGKWILVLLGMAVLAVSSLGTDARLEKNTLLVNEQPVLTLQFGVAAKRTKIAIERIKKAGSTQKARAVARGTRALLLLGDHSILRVEPEDAAAAKMPALALAKIWAANINAALTLPPLKLGAYSIKIANGKEFRVPFSGSLAGVATVESSDETVVKAKKAPGALVFNGVMAGAAQVVVSAGGQVATIDVKVVPLAAVFPQYSAATVTGLPATSSISKGAVESAVWNQLKTQPGADVKFTVPEMQQIPAGEARTVMVRVRANAPESLPSEGWMYVTVRNVPFQVEPENELWYCNHPENIQKLGSLFAARLRGGSPARMLFHHINDSPRGLNFHAQIVNDSDKAARILIIPGDSPTDKNPVFAGIEAADRFLRNWMYSSGEILVVPPGQSIPISLKRLAPRETVSGLVYLALLSGGPESILVRADARQTFQPDARWLAALNSNSPWRVVGTLPTRGDDALAKNLSDHIYPQPFKDVEVNYMVGGRHGFVRIGQQPIISQAGDRYLDGNFGVIYKIRARVENPTTVAADVELVFEASAGYSGALFALNGQVFRTPLLQPKDERRILTLKVEPGGSKEFTLHTIPLSGGSYPATLALRPLDRTTRTIAGFGMTLQR